MREQEIKNQIDELTEKLKFYNKKYYEDDAPVISDAEYDALLRQLSDLEEKYPQFAHSDSPTQKVGGKASEAFSSVKHPAQLLSLENAFSFEELEAFNKRVEKNTDAQIKYCTELKMDGLTVVLTYKDGKLIQGATRGDGLSGENITANINVISEIPKILPDKLPLLVVRGEVYMPKNTFLELNSRREESGEPLFANPRNAAAGSLRQLNPAVTAQRGLKIFVYDIVSSDGFMPKTQSELLEYLQKQGFPVNDLRISSNDLNEICKFI